MDLIIEWIMDPVFEAKKILGSSFIIDINTEM